jgi:hypothetical protein
MTSPDVVSTLCFSSSKQAMFTIFSGQSTSHLRSVKQVVSAGVIINLPTQPRLHETQQPARTCKQPSFSGDAAQQRATRCKLAMTVAGSS